MLAQEQPIEEVDDRPFRLVDDADDFRADLQQEHQHADNDERHPVAHSRARRHRLNDGASAEESRNAIDDDDGLAMAEAELLQPVVQVPFVRGENRFLLHPAPHDREERIRQRHPDDEDRRYERYDGDLLEPEHRQHRERESEEKRSRVAHEDFRRMEVVVQESHHAAEQNGRQQDNRALAHQRGHDENRRDRDAGYPGGQPVQPVDQVDRVRDADDPDDRQRDAQPVAHRLHGRSERNIHEIDLNIETEDDDASRRDLNEKLQLRIQLEPVVQRAEQHDHRASDQQSPDKALVMVAQEAVRKPWQKQQNRCGKSSINRKPAHAGHNARMHLAVIRHVHGADLDR